MVIRRKFLEPGAAVNYIQVGHRQTAVEYAVAGIEKHRNANLKAFSGDALFTELENTTGEWVIETLYQGAYMREYHLWEKDCKQYFGGFSRGGKDSFNVKVRAAFAEHGLAIPEKVFAGIETMRSTVNMMKHADGLTLEHFVTRSHYEEAISAIEEFWNYLATRESVSYG